MDCLAERTELHGADGRNAGGKSARGKQRERTPYLLVNRVGESRRRFQALVGTFSTAFSTRFDPVCFRLALRLANRRQFELLRPRHLGRRTAGHRSATPGDTSRLLPTQCLLRAGSNPRAGWCGLAGGDPWGAGGSEPEVGPVGTPVGALIFSLLVVLVLLNNLLKEGARTARITRLTFRWTSPNGRSECLLSIRRYFSSKFFRDSLTTPPQPRRKT